MKARIKVEITKNENGNILLFFYPQTKKNFFSRWKGSEGYIDYKKAYAVLLQKIKVKEHNMLYVDKQFQPVHSTEFVTNNNLIS